MPAPSPSWNLVRVYGTWRNLDGTPKRGVYKVSIPVKITNATDDSVISAGTFSTGTLAGDAGQPSIDVMVPATDDPDVQQTGWLVTVEVTFADRSKTERFRIEVPYADRPAADGGTGNGVNLRGVVSPDTIPVKDVLFKVGVPGGIALLDSNGNALNADGTAAFQAAAVAATAAEGSSLQASAAATSASTAASQATSARDAAQSSAAAAAASAALIGSPSASAIDLYLGGGSGASLAGKFMVTDGGEAAGAGTGGPNRPNIQIGGPLNGSAIQPDQIHSVLLQPGGPGFNNIIGGDGSATVNTPTPNVASNVGNVGVSLIGGYDNVAGAISSKIISDHCFTAPGSPGHNGIYGGAIHKATVNASFSMIASGQNNTADAAYAFLTGNGNTVSGVGGAAFGAASTVSGTYGLSQGNTNTVAGAYGLAQGQLCQVDKNWGSAEGQYAYSRNGSQRTIAAGRISATGDAQTSVTPFLKQTTNNTEIKMSPGSGLPDWVMVRGQSVMVEAMFVARAVGGATMGAWIVKTLCAWDAAGASFNLGSPTVETLYTANAALAVRVDAVSSVGAILPKVTGLAGTTINWSCRMTTVEVMA